MKKKDIIYVTNDEGVTEEMEVVITFKLEESNKNCIIYKNINSEDEKYYAAQYDKNNDITTLDTNFTDIEKEQINTIFKNIKEEESQNA